MDIVNHVTCHYITKKRSSNKSELTHKMNEKLRKSKINPRNFSSDIKIHSWSIPSQACGLDKFSNHLKKPYKF